jgi:acetylornithine aminotransferase
MSILIGYPGHEVLLDDIVRAEGVSLFDSQGKRYVDLESGVWCATVGHGHPRVIRALREQAGRIAHAGYCYSSEVVRDAAEELLRVLDMSGGRGVFLCSGTEAVEFGVRSLQQGSARPLLLTMTDSYFGAYGSAHRRIETEWYGYDWLGCADCPANEDGSRDCEHRRRIPFDRIGGFLFEPGSSSGFVRFPPEAMIRAIVARVRAEGGLLMVNEVTTGLGRTGTWFGHEHYGIRPDVVALGKSLGNGYPVSFTAFAPGVFDRLCRHPLSYAQSHQNDPLGAAVAREVVRVIREDHLIQRSLESATVLMTGLEGIRERTRGGVASRGRGLMVAVDLEDDPANERAIRVQRELVRRGFILARRAGTSTFRIDPALTIEPRDLRDFLTTLEAVLAGQ